MLRQWMRPAKPQRNEGFRAAQLVTKRRRCIRHFRNALHDCTDGHSRDVIAVKRRAGMRLTSVHGPNTCIGAARLCFNKVDPRNQIL